MMVFIFVPPLFIIVDIHKWQGFYGSKIFK